MPRMDRIGYVHTKVKLNKETNILTVTYHKTVVVEWDKNTDTVTLRNGGYKTVTTKNRINQTANQYNLSFGVFQENREWWVDLPKGGVVPFEDGMSFTLPV